MAQGYTSEALGAVINFLFDEVGLNRIAARHDVNNSHSGGVMKKCGMQFEGIMREGAKNNAGLRHRKLCDFEERSRINRVFGRKFKIFLG